MYVNHFYSDDLRDGLSGRVSVPSTVLRRPATGALGQPCGFLEVTASQPAWPLQFLLTGLAVSPRQRHGSEGD